MKNDYRVHKQVDILMRLIDGGRSLTLKALDGKRLIYKSSNIFQFDSDDTSFVDLGLNKPGVATPTTLVQVNEVVSDGSHFDIFNSFFGPWSKKWLSQTQIIEFCEVYPGLLIGGGISNLFLSKIDENLPIDENAPQSNLVVVSVFNAKDLRVGVRRLAQTPIWRGHSHRRVITPELITREDLSQAFSTLGIM
ncbi:MAG: hypothetical protein WC249_01880 [Patescibacteria group bacterium]|jgi:hypothetical protein